MGSRQPTSGRCNIRQNRDETEDNSKCGNLLQYLEEHKQDIASKKVKASLGEQRIMWSMGKWRISIGSGKNDWNDCELDKLDIKQLKIK